MILYFIGAHESFTSITERQSLQPNYIETTDWVIGDSLHMMLIPIQQIELEWFPQKFETRRVTWAHHH